VWLGWTGIRVAGFHHQELATILLNYHFGRIVPGTMCVGVSVRLGWSGIRAAGFHHQELATILLNYHFGRIVLGTMCVGISVWLGWSGIRVAVVLQPATRIQLQPNHTETPTHIEPRTIRPMW